MKRATEIYSRWNGFVGSSSLGMQFGHVPQSTKLPKPLELATHWDHNAADRKNRQGHSMTSVLVCLSTLKAITKLTKMEIDRLSNRVIGCAVGARLSFSPCLCVSVRAQ
jgi:hypothetical protein